MRYTTIDNWTNYFRENEGVVISISAIRNRIKIANIVGETRADVRGKLYSEEDVRKACGDLLKDLPQSDDDGFFVYNENKYGSVTAWSEVIKLSEPTIARRIQINSIQSIKGKDRSGKICDFFPESEIMRISSDLQEEFFQADDSGFFEKDGQKYGTFLAWSKILGISRSAIFKRIMAGNINCLKGKNCTGRVIDFISENEVRRACADLLTELPQADDSGFCEKDGQKYGTIPTLGKILGISTVVISGRIKHNKLKAEIGRSKAGILYDYYSVNEVRRICSDLQEEFFQADDSGFFEKDGQKYGTIIAWERLLGLSQRVISRRIDINGISGIKGKKNSNIFDFYPESEIRRACADLLTELPQADDSGFFEKDGQKYGTAVALKQILGISKSSIVRRAQKNKIFFIKGKSSTNHVLDFYPESEVRRACADLLTELPQADDRGFFEQYSQIYGTINAWEKTLGISQNAILRRIELNDIKGVKGKIQKGRICDFYPESEVRRICADLSKYEEGQANRKAA